MKIVLASNNAKKLSELKAILPTSFDIQAAGPYDSPEETGLTFVENAIIKARFVSELTSSPCIADDSGLEVDFLKGEPGIYSARFSGDNATDETNNIKLLNSLEGVPDSQRSARFRCVIVYLRHAKDPMPLISAGTWEGKILKQPLGDNGFGYDPLFYIPALGKSSAQLQASEKNQYSHRALALKQLQSQLSFT